MSGLVYTHSWNDMKMKMKKQKQKQKQNNLCTQSGGGGGGGGDGGRMQPIIGNSGLSFGRDILISSDGQREFRRLFRDTNLRFRNTYPSRG
jgi:hypothetical protein